VGIGLSVVVTNGEATFDLVVREFPVLFGRDPSSHVPLPHGFVSKTHAAIDFRDGRLLLRDLGALNRITVGDKPIAPNAEVDLGKRGGAFAIGQLRIAVSVIEADEPPENVSSITGKPFATVRVDHVDVLAKGMDATASSRELADQFDRYRNSWSDFARLLSERVGHLSPSARADFLSDAAQRYGAAAHEPEFRRLLEQHGIGTSPAESQALNVLRTLARWYLDLPLETDTDIEQFGLRIRKTLDEFLHALLPTRDGLRITEQTLSGGDRASGLDAVTNEAQLADHLLNWQRPGDGARDLRKLLTKVKIHQVGLMNGIMHGIEALLAQLSPTAIEADVREGRTKDPRKFVLGQWGLHRVLWEEFRRRHDDFASEEGGRFAVVFGPECAASYRQIAEDLTPKTHTGAPLDPRGAGGSDAPYVAPAGTVVLPGARGRQKG
jgi:type VI secretion system protein ImpI